MFDLKLFISLLFLGYTSSLNLPRCPYPLPEYIEPCICEVDERYRMILTCYQRTDLTEDTFNRIIDAFDFNNKIYSINIDLDSSYQKMFYPQLNALNIGKLNITLFSLKNAEIPNTLFGEGAFDGSAGSIQNITVQNLRRTGTNGSIDLGSHVLYPACPTMQSLKLELVSQLSSTSLINSPNLQEVSFKYSTFPNIPSALFSTENIPNIQSISIGVQEDLNLQTDAFRDLPYLTNLEISANQIDIIQSYALNNLPNLQHLELTGTYILRIEEDALKDLTSLKSLDIDKSGIEELPRIFSNSPSLTTFSLTDGDLMIVEENAFIGVPSLEELNLSENTKLAEFKLTNMKNLTTINLVDDSELSSLYLSELPKLSSLSFRRNSILSSVRLDNLPSLTNLNMNGDSNKKESLQMNITNCQNLESFYANEHKLVTISLEKVDALTTLIMYANPNLNHTGLGSSLHSINSFDAQIDLRETNVRNLDESVFRPLLETFTSVESASGYIDMYNVDLDCGCDVKWIIEDFHFQTHFFTNAKCVGGGTLADVDPILLDMMCPP